MGVEDVWAARRVEGHGVDLSVRDSGSAGPTLVFLHGLGGYSAEWWPVARHLLDTFRVVAGDQRGHGESTTRPGDLSRTAYVADVAAVLDHLGLERVVLVGQSMGAHTALLAAAALPGRVAGTVLVEGGVGGGGRGPTDEVIAWFESWPTPFQDAVVAAEYFGGGEAGRVWAAGLREGREGLVPRFDTNVLRAAISPVHDTERWTEWRATTTPTLVVRGAAGYLEHGEAQQMLRENPYARLVEVPGSGHDVHLDAAEPLAEHIRAFALGLS